jgi:SNF2 family DNA or RNA helicase
MQNNLKEYFAMVNFCKPNFLGTEYEFSEQFRKPIEAGQHRDSSHSDVAYMRRRIFALNRRLQTVIHRQGFDVLRSFLPPKFEYGNLMLNSVKIFFFFYFPQRLKSNVDHCNENSMRHTFNIRTSMP